MATLKSFKGFVPMELGLGRHYINGFIYVDDSNQSYYVQTDNAKAYLVSSNIINYYPEVSFPKVKRVVLDPVEFDMTLDEVIDITEAEVTQHQITNYFADTLAEAKALTYKKQERVKIFELDEVYECVEVSATPVGYASSTPLQIGSDLYFLSYDANTYGQLYKQAAGVTTVVYAFAQNGNGTNPIGTLITDGTYIYIETTQGGSNNLGTLVKYNISTGSVTKMLDFNATIGNSANPFIAGFPTNDKAINGTDLYLSTSQGGSNNLGTIIKVDLSTNAVTILFDHDTMGNTVRNTTASKGYGVIVGGYYYTFTLNKMYKIDLATDVVTTTTTPLTVVGIGTTPNAGFLIGTDIYLFSDVHAQPIKIETANTDNIVDSQYNGATDFGTYGAFKDGIYTYHWDYNMNYLVRWEIGTTNIVQNSTDHSLLSDGKIFNGNFDVANNLFYYMTGASSSTLDKIYKYDISAKTNTLIYDLQSIVGGAVADDEYLIEIDQSATSSLYLRVRDNHTKTVALDSAGLGIDVTTTRGVVSNIAFPTSTIDFWAYQYATNTTNGNALDVKGLAGFKVISDNLTLLAKTASNNVFNGNDIFLPEGIYNIQASFYMIGQVSANLLKLEVKAIGTSAVITETSIDSNKLFTTRYTTKFDPIVVDSALATSGIRVRINGIDTSGSFLNIYDIRLNITKIGDNV